MLHLCLLLVCAALHAGQMLQLQWPASGLSRQMLYLFLAAMVVGHFWYVIAAQMQHLVLCTSSHRSILKLQSLLNIIEMLLTSVHLHIWIHCHVHSIAAQKQSFWISSMTSFSSLSNSSNLCR